MCLSPGPEGDRAPVWKKTWWTFCMYHAQQDQDKGDYQGSRALLDIAEILARDFQDNHARLLGTYKEQAETYQHLGATDAEMYKAAEVTNQKINQLNRDQVTHDYDVAMKELSSMDASPNQSVAFSVNRYHAEG